MADKTEALQTLIQTLNIEPEQKTAAEKAVFEREKIISTGVGKGIAVPHCKIDMLKKHQAAFAILDEPVPFDSIDNEPVRILFLLASPQQDNGEHLKLLSRISRLLNNSDLKEKLIDSRSSEDLLNVFHQEELKYKLNE